MNDATFPLTISAEVRQALDDGAPIVAFESTVYSTLGLPEPHNHQVLQASQAAVRGEGAVPALTAVIRGQAIVGLDDVTPVLAATDKVAARDLAVALAQRWPVGVTTVGASLTLAHRAGIKVFATGGIGGVHQNAAVTGDISGDLPVIARYPIVTVCAGAKSFLDLRRTLEMLETLGVVVVGFGTDELPAFTAASSGLEAPNRIDDPSEIAQLIRLRHALGQGGVLVCVPPPRPIAPELLADATAQAESQADAANVTGPERTPFILAAIADATNGASVSANTALVENNARVAAQIAAAL